MKFLLGLAIGTVVGVVYHVVLQPYITRAWAWIKTKTGG